MNDDLNHEFVAVNVIFYLYIFSGISKRIVVIIMVSKTDRFLK